MEKDEQLIIFIDNIFYCKIIDLCFENWWEKFEKIYENEFVGKENEIGLYLGCF